MNETCADSVKVARRESHHGRGGSIPASALFFHVGMGDDVASLVLKSHYSHRVAGAVQFVGSLHEAGGLFGTCGPIVAGVTFSIPPTRWSEPVIELSRLVRRDDLAGIPLTLMIRLSLSKLKASGHDLVVSFADMTQGHHGFVYQAAGWNYAGLREPRQDGLIVDGQFVPGRSCNSAWGTSSPSRLREAMPKSEIEPHMDGGKHLYWKALTKSGEAKAMRLGLERLAYPKRGPQP